jgi:hypothetical protein
MNDRIIICGWPNSGKSHHAEELSAKLGIPVRHTDSLIRTMQWSDVSETVSHWFDEPGPWIIEGVAIPRALRKWKARNPDTNEVPFDKLIIMPEPDTTEMKPGQISMGRGHDTVLKQLEDWIGGYL